MPLRNGKASLWPVVVLIGVATTAGSAAEDVDFMSIILDNTALSGELGIAKLTETERESWNELLNRAYELGYQQASQSPASSGQQATSPPSSPSVASGTAYVTKVDDDNDDVLELANGAIVEVTSGYLGYLGYRKDCVLYKTGRKWRIWIEGKRSFPCDILKAPTSSLKRSVEEVFISRVLANGKILELGNGAMYEVSDIHLVDTGIWIGGSSALIIDGYRLLNLDESGEIVDITPVGR